MSKRAELQKRFDDRLDDSFGHLRFSRYGKCAISLLPLAASGLQLTAYKVSVPAGFMDSAEVSSALESEAQIEAQLADVMAMPTLTPSTGIGLNVLYSRWRQNRLARQIMVAPGPPEPVGAITSEQPPIGQPAPEPIQEQHEIAV